MLDQALCLTIVALKKIAYNIDKTLRYKIKLFICIDFAKTDKDIL